MVAGVHADCVLGYGSGAGVACLVAGAAHGLSIWLRGWPLPERSDAEAVCGLRERVVSCRG